MPISTSTTPSSRTVPNVSPGSAYQPRSAASRSTWANPITVKPRPTRPSAVPPRRQPTTASQPPAATPITDSDSRSGTDELTNCAVSGENRATQPAPRVSSRPIAAPAQRPLGQRLTGGRIEAQSRPMATAQAAIRDALTTGLTGAASQLVVVAGTSTTL